MVVFRSIFGFETIYIVLLTFHFNVLCDDNVVIETTHIEEDLNGLDQEDPRLIEAVRSRLIEPSPDDLQYVFRQNDVQRWT